MVQSLSLRIGTDMKEMLLDEQSIIEAISGFSPSLNKLCSSLLIKGLTLSQGYEAVPVTGKLQLLGLRVSDDLLERLQERAAQLGGEASLNKLSIYLLHVALLESLSKRSIRGVRGSGTSGLSYT